MKELREMTHNSIMAFLSAKPHIGIITSFAGLGAAILTWMHVLTIVFGFAGALIGFAAGVYSFMIQRRKWKVLRNHTEKP